MILALVPSPAHAHTIGGSRGAELELLLIAVLCFLFGMGLRSSDVARRWVPYAVMGLGGIVAVASFAVPRL